MQSNETHLNTEATGTTHHDVSVIFLLLQAYWDSNPSILFIQAESQFMLSGVRTKQRKYHLVVSALSSAVAEEAAALLSGSPSTTPHNTFKAALQAQTTASQRSRIKRLLSAKELGHRRPSQLLRHMCQLMSSYTTTTDENWLRELFVQCLSGNVKSY
ncbi:hypothetical protein HPB51_005694 [Rhipicephalus microplus]|uniref:DUF7041 domain-containing protein n=1 Tax=Rhipicephalus microplus TaxID=6941 RepID=A0A9J6E761_RHIMP|nr:hypothetical protein HPB51_005694 [Rhipicephalus microplus]